MVVRFEFASVYATILDQKFVDVEMETDHASLDEVLARLLCQFPGWDVLLEKNGYYENGKLKAMYVSEQNIMSGDSLVKDGAHVRMLLPICGG